MSIRLGRASVLLPATTTNSGSTLYVNIRGVTFSSKHSGCGLTAMSTLQSWAAGKPWAYGAMSSKHLCTSPFHKANMARGAWRHAAVLVRGKSEHRNHPKEGHSDFADWAAYLLPDLHKGLLNLHGIEAIQGVGHPHTAGVAAMLPSNRPEPAARSHCWHGMGKQPSR